MPVFTNSALAECHIDRRLPRAMPRMPNAAGHTLTRLTRPHRVYRYILYCDRRGPAHLLYLTCRGWRNCGAVASRDNALRPATRVFADNAAHTPVIAQYAENFAGILRIARTI